MNPLILVPDELEVELVEISVVLVGEVYVVPLVYIRPGVLLVVLDVSTAELLVEPELVDAPGAADEPAVELVPDELL